MKRIIFLVITVLLAILLYFGISQFLYVEKAHSTFENYYAFRGCAKLLQKTNTFATCQLASGKQIKLVVVRGKWYLDGDLPVCLLGKCW